MIKTVEFHLFRGFTRLRAELLPHAYIVGPNSAGKSTVLEAIALAEQCIRIARRKLPTITISHNGQSWRAYKLPANNVSEDDPVRYDFGKDEARVTVEWANRARVNIIWPEETVGDEEGYFYLEQDDGGQPNSLAAARNLFSTVTIVPVITPLEKYEELKTAVYIEANQVTRLASRHFRNNMFLMRKAAPGVRIVVASPDEVKQTGDGQERSCEAIFSRTERGANAADDAAAEQAGVGAGPRERDHGADPLYLAPSTS